MLETYLKRGWIISLYRNRGVVWQLTQTYMCIKGDVFLYLTNRITESQDGWGWRSPSGDHLAQRPCSRRVHYSMSHRIVTRQLLNFSREGESTTSLGNLFLCSVTLTLKFFLMISFWWIHADYSLLSSTCLEMASRMSCSITFPEIEVRMTHL